MVLTKNDEQLIDNAKNLLDKSKQIEESAKLVLKGLADHAIMSNDLDRMKALYEKFPDGAAKWSLHFSIRWYGKSECCEGSRGSKRLVEPIIS